MNWARKYIEANANRQTAQTAITNELGEFLMLDEALRVAAPAGPMTVKQALRDIDQMARTTDSPAVAVLTGWCAEAGIELESALVALAQAQGLQGDDCPGAYFKSIGISGTSDMKLARELWASARAYGLRQAIVWQDVILWGNHFGAVGPSLKVMTIWALVHHCAATQLPLDVELEAQAQRMDDDDPEAIWDVAAIAFGCTERNLMGRLSNYAALSGEPLANLLVTIEGNSVVKRLSAGEYAERLLRESQRMTGAEPGSSRQGGIQ